MKTLTPKSPEVVVDRSPITRFTNVLASVKFAVTVIILIALACVAGTLLPQGKEVAGFLEKYPAAANWLPLLSQLGFTHLFYSWWFLALLCVLAITVATCTLRRVATLRRATGFARRRAFGSMVAHVSILLILAGGVVRGVWGEKGYLELREGETKSQFQVENTFKPLPFALQLAKFEILSDSAGGLVGEVRAKEAHQLIVQWPERDLSARFPIEPNVTHTLKPEGEEITPENSFQITVLKYLPDFTMNAETREIISRSTEPNNPALLVAVKGPSYENNRWVFAKFRDFVVHREGSQANPLRFRYEHPTAAKQPLVTGPIRNFKSTLRVIENGGVVQINSVAVNSPFKYKGYTLFQTGYNPRDLAWTSLQIVRDPGVPLVYAGFALLIIGLAIVFYLNPWLEARRKAQA